MNADLTPEEQSILAAVWGVRHGPDFFTRNFAARTLRALRWFDDAHGLNAVLWSMVEKELTL